jgi:hypothetical protein
LIAAVLGLVVFSALLIVLFDTPWNRMLLGFGCVLGFISVLIQAWRKGVPLVPNGVRALPVQPARNDSLRRWVPPIWIALFVLWAGAGFLVTNGGG